MGGATPRTRIFIDFFLTPQPILMAVLSARGKSRHESPVVIGGLHPLGNLVILSDLPYSFLAGVRQLNCIFWPNACPEWIAKKHSGVKQPLSVLDCMLANCPSQCCLYCGRKKLNQPGRRK